MIDLDDFKSINDTYGHDAGDHYLQKFSEVMKSMPEAHFLSARRSGDEFCMLIFDCRDKEEITGFLHTFYDTLRQNTVDLSCTESKTISASCGFAITNEPPYNIARLLSHADEALYEIKRSTKGDIWGIP